MKKGLRLLAREWLLVPGLSRLIVQTLGQKTGEWEWSNESRNPLDEYTRGSRWKLLRDALAEARGGGYLEYGSGLSTEFVAANFDCKIRSVETSPYWVEKMRIKLGNRVEFLHVDLGPVGGWGRPLGYKEKDSFSNYRECGFGGKYSPEVILIDGRFRVAVFLTCLKLSRPGTLIVFDDYPSKAHYHVVENLISPAKANDHQAIFVTPEDIDSELLAELLHEFSCVME